MSRPTSNAQSTAAGAAISWDLTQRTPSLADALLLRMRAELNAWTHGTTNGDDVSALRVTLRGTSPRWPQGEMLLRRVFAASGFAFQVETTAAENRPVALPLPAPAADEATVDFAPLAELSAARRVTPRLHWSDTARRDARMFRRHFAARLYAVHVPRAVFAQADDPLSLVSQWMEFFARHARPGECEFLVLGDDPVEFCWRLGAGAYRAADLGMDTMTQLALLETVQGYLGYSSGVSCAAHFSDVPQVVFDAAAAPAALPFATTNQVRRPHPASAADLAAAFQFLSAAPSTVTPLPALSAAA
ncbi:hypothetical protein [Actomonas aquatica]|uniref:Nitroreductase domain-containing protein n=1 Tax=Actomonas aquatica TaxID=2866162 RepID=A0ABZ1CCK6_9BACT|nr:hypothetical protein [Opitutus sp. WL0086]WRQ89316.1 hypothetical protein K1X11_007840 [Opitutus sp. WL0086]